eukprot:10039924-Heterocapsa_arctica.AAC.1
MAVRYSAARLRSAAQNEQACLEAQAHLRKIEPEARQERLALEAPHTPGTKGGLAAKLGELIAQEGAQEATPPQASLTLEDS